MKNNAIVRIVIWSLVILALTAVLVFFLGIRIGFIPDVVISSSHIENMEALPVESDDTVYYNKAQTDPITATVLEELSLRASPSPQAETHATLSPGTVLEVKRTETIGGELWGYVVEPAPGGWIQMQYVEAEITLPQEYTFSGAPASTTPAVPENTGNQETITATVLEDMNMRNSPSSMAEVVTMLPAGTKLDILKTETVDGKLWGYVETPAPGGWVVMQYVKTDAPLPEAELQSEPLPASAYPANVTPLLIPANEVREISIDWAAGNITVCLVENSDDILFYEEGGNPDRPMNSTHRQGKLSIEFCDKRFSGFGLGSDASKDLTIQIPKGAPLSELEIDAGSARLHVQDLTLQSVELDTASGKADFVNCHIGALDVNTASGDITYEGTLDSLECEAVSANFGGKLSAAPRRVEMESASGDLHLTLPETSGFSVRIEGLSRNFSSDFDYTQQNGRYVHGDGTCRIEMEAMSGKVTIKKAQ